VIHELYDTNQEGRVNIVNCYLSCGACWRKGPHTSFYLWSLVFSQ